MDTTQTDNKQTKASTLLKNIETLGKRFRKEHLGSWDPSKLESDWFNALCFLLERNFMRGRRDEISNVFLSFAIDRLQYHLRPSDDLTAAFRTLMEHHASAHLDSSRIIDFKKRQGMKGTANAVAHEAFAEEIAADNPVVKLLTSLCEVTVKWPSEHQKTTRLSNDKDLMMVLDTLHLVCQPGCQNIYLYLLQQIKAGRPKTAYKTLDDIYAVGDKLASMTLRDICMMQSGVVLDDVSDVFPIDTWVKQTAKLLGCEVKSDSEIKAFFRKRCSECDVDIMLFAAGMWYLGANALTILVDDFLGKYEIPAGEQLAARMQDDKLK